MIKNTQRGIDMRIFNVDGKINFVDDNNVFVGYDMNENCCEKFGYMLNKKIPTNMNIFESDLEESDLEEFNFANKFIRDLPHPEYYEEGGAKCFRLEKNNEEAYLTIYNYHNGYYSHGFEFSYDGKIIEEGRL
jgi:hypothetical protein